MAWRIHSWSAETGTGEVVSSHFGPWRFGPDQNPAGTDDFEVGDEVLVELAGKKGDYTVRSVVRLPRRADDIPAGTDCAVFEELNSSRFPDMTIEERTEGSLSLWVGDCCRWCGDSWSVRFGGVSAVRGLDEDADLDEPIFRYATDAEILEEQLAVPEGARAFRIVTTPYAAAPPSSGNFVVAETVEVESLSPVR